MSEVFILKFVAARPMHKLLMDPTIYFRPEMCPGKLTLVNVRANQGE